MDSPGGSFGGAITFHLSRNSFRSCLSNRRIENQNVFLIYSYQIMGFQKNVNSMSAKQHS